MHKRVTTPEELDRWAENIITGARLKAFKDPDAIDRKINDHIKGSNYNSKQRSVFNQKVRPRIFNKLRGSLFKRAGGKNFNQDLRSTAKVVVNTEEEYIKQGASKVDLDGLDTKNGQITYKAYNKVGRIKGRTVFVLKTKVMIKGKEFVRFRDKKGRFAKFVK